MEYGACGCVRLHEGCFGAMGAPDADTAFLTFFIKFTIPRCSAENCGIIRGIEASRRAFFCCHTASLCGWMGLP